MEHAYLNGSCWFLALALHRRTGWPIWALSLPGCPDRESVPEIVGHVCVRSPEGRYLDVRGEMSRKEFMRGWDRPSARMMAPLSEEELIAIVNADFGGLDAATMEDSERVLDEIFPGRFPPLSDWSGIEEGPCGYRP
jgi:hypothetical protein